MLFAVVAVCENALAHVAVAVDVALEQSGDVGADMCLGSVEFEKPRDFGVGVFAGFELERELVDATIDFEEVLEELRDGTDGCGCCVSEVAFPSHERNCFLRKNADYFSEFFRPLGTGVCQFSGRGREGRLCREFLGIV